MKGSYVPKIHEELHVLESKTTTLPNVLQSLGTQTCFLLGSGYGTVVRVVVSDTRDPRFKFSRGHFCIYSVRKLPRL